MTANGLTGNPGDAGDAAAAGYGAHRDQPACHLQSILRNPDPMWSWPYNSLWSRQELTLTKTLQRNRDYFAAEINALDFNLPEAVLTINRWVEKTRGKIKDRRRSNRSPDLSFLINAIHFNVPVGRIQSR